MRNVNDGFNSLLAGKRVVTVEQVDGPQEGRVISVDAPNQRAQVAMVNSAFGEEKQFEVDYDDSLTPVVGDKCLLVFVGQGVDRGWLLASKADS